MTARGHCRNTTPLMVLNLLTLSSFYDTAEPPFLCLDAKSFKVIAGFKESFSLQTMPSTALLSVAWNIKSCIKKTRHLSLYFRYKIYIIFYYYRKIFDTDMRRPMTVYKVSSIVLAS